MKTGAWTRFCRPEFAGYTFHTHVNCACGAVETRTSWTADTEEAEAERARLAVAQAVSKGWTSDGDATNAIHRCPACVAGPVAAAESETPPAPRFADGTMPGTETRCRGSAEWCRTHGRPTVHMGEGPVCKVSGQRPEPSR